MKEKGLIINNPGKGKLPRLPFVSIKEAVLGRDYSLTLNFVDSALSQKLNLQYRDKNKPTDILSFPYSETEGEIFIDLKASKKEALKFEREFNNFIGFLFIHGLVHLKGIDHGKKMENEEIIHRKRFNI